MFENSDYNKFKHFEDWADYCHTKVFHSQYILVKKKKFKSYCVDQIYEFETK